MIFFVKLNSIRHVSRRFPSLPPLHAASSPAAPPPPVLAPPSNAISLLFSGGQSVPYGNATSRKHVQPVLRPRPHHAHDNGPRSHGSGLAAGRGPPDGRGATKDAPLRQIRGMDPPIYLPSRSPHYFDLL